MTATLAIPTDASELEDFLHDPVRFGQLATEMAKGNVQPLQDFVKGYATASSKRDEELVVQFREQIQRGLRDFLIENGSDVGRIDMSDVIHAKKQSAAQITNKDKGQVYNSAAPGAVLDQARLFKDAREFFYTAWHNKSRLRNGAEFEAKAAKYHEIVNAASSTVPSDGGFLIPEILRSEILGLSLEGAIVRPKATVIPMDSLKVPIPAVDETSRVSSIFGGIQFYWTPEGAALIDSSAKFGQVTLDAKKLTGYAGIPNELLMDATAFLAWFGAKFPQGNGWFQDIAFLTGDGTDKPLGIQNGAGVVSQARTTTSHIRYEDLVAMYARMYPSSIGKAEWVASIDTFTELAELYFIPGGGTIPVPVMLWLPNAVGTPQPTILGRPITFTEKIGPLGTAGDIMFADFSEYLIGDRQAMSLESSTDYLFGTDKTAFRVISRVDGRPWLQSAITPHNNSSNTLSPYVILAH